MAAALVDLLKGVNQSQHGEFCDFKQFVVHHSGYCRPGGKTGACGSSDNIDTIDNSVGNHAGRGIGTGL